MQAVVLPVITRDKDKFRALNQSHTFKLISFSLFEIKSSNDPDQIKSSNDPDHLLEWNPDL